MKRCFTRTPERFPLLKIVKVCLLANVATLVAFAVSNPDQLPQRGVSPTGSYFFDKLESINKTTGNLSYSIPLMAMPLGRGGFSIPISLTYNSSQFDYGYSYTSGGDYPNPPILNQHLQASQWGGWNLAVGYSVYVEQKALSPSCSASSDSQRQSDLT